MQKPLFSVYFRVPTIISMCIDLFDPQTAKKNKNAFEFPAETRVNIVRNIALLGPPDSWQQDLELGPRMDIFGPVEQEIWQFEVS